MTARLTGKLDKATFEVYLQETRIYERMLFDEGFVLLKFWIHLSKNGLHERLQTLEKPTGIHKSFKLDYRAVRAYQKLKALDPDHPVVITQAPLGTVASLTPYRSAFDITGADIYPVSYPPGVHSDLPNKDISVVGDMTRKMVTAAGGKSVWMTLQIAWSGVIQNQTHPDNVPRFPTLHEERFMVYQAIVAGARGLVFYGGDFTTVMRPRDASLGWNWFFWQTVLHPLLTELTSTAVRPALVAPNAPTQVTANEGDVDILTRKDGQTLYVIAVRRDPTTTNKVAFGGIPTNVSRGEVLFEYVQKPLSPPVDPTKQAFRVITVTNGGFQDWFGPHDARVYRFTLV